MKKRKTVLKLIVSVMFAQLMFVTVSCAQHEEGGEEDGTQFTKEQTYDVVKKGVRLILKYDKASSSFKGTIENKSGKAVERARVEVHLSNGLELGPTKPKDLKIGEKINVSLSAKKQDFKTWSTHAEIGSNEHGHGEGGEHKEKGNKEHKSKEGRGEHSAERNSEHR